MSTTFSLAALALVYLACVALDAADERARRDRANAALVAHVLSTHPSQKGYG